jgi:hypothetical protein
LEKKKKAKRKKNCKRNKGLSYKDLLSEVFKGKHCYDGKEKMTNREFKCNNAVEDCIKWLKKNKDKIHDGGMSATINLEIKPDFEEEK